MAEIETLNKFMVTMEAGTGRLVIGLPPCVLSQDDALLLAAWLVAMSEPQAKNTFEDVLKAVQST